MKIWIAVDDHYPMVGGYYIVTDGRIRKLCRWRGSRGWVQIQSASRLENEAFKVTHWISVQELMHVFALPSGFIEEEKKKNKNKLLSLSIYEIPMSVRTTNCLINSGIRTLGDLLSASEESLNSIKNLGKKSGSEIKALCEKYRKTYGL